MYNRAGMCCFPALEDPVEKPLFKWVKEATETYMYHTQQHTVGLHTVTFLRAHVVI